MRAELIFIPAPGAGHLVSAVEFAKLLASRDERISISILIMKFRFDSTTGALPRNLKKEAHERIAFVDIPDLDESTLTELIFLPMISFFTSLIERQQTLACLAQQVTTILKQSKSGKLGGFVIDMLCLYD
ncbi:UDP-glucosyltransferase 103-like [Apium graveolens]|uniref:UDP-glucosyltransferase 103-like n=1 Tax=Apium graveolens TaxID=4045 RepID=UPI003D7A6B96